MKDVCRGDAAKVCKDYMLYALTEISKEKKDYARQVLNSKMQELAKELEYDSDCEALCLGLSILVECFKML